MQEQCGFSDPTRVHFTVLDVAAKRTGSNNEDILGLYLLSRIKRKIHTMGMWIMAGIMNCNRILITWRRPSLDISLEITAKSAKVEQVALISPRLLCLSSGLEVATSLSTFVQTPSHFAGLSSSDMSGMYVGHLGNREGQSLKVLQKKRAKEAHTRKPPNLSSKTLAMEDLDGEGDEDDDGEDDDGIVLMWDIRP
ncbi:hypothetical protein LguiA_017824 [Lonicera macranthoides]